MSTFRLNAETARNMAIFKGISPRYNPTGPKTQKDGKKYEEGKTLTTQRTEIRGRRIYPKTEISKKRHKTIQKCKKTPP
jgi:hypothetical protein